MKKLTTIVATLITASALSTVAFASSDDNSREKLRSAEASVTALAKTLENLGQTVDTNVNLDGAYTPAQKTAAYKAKHAELQAQFNELQENSVG